MARAWIANLATGVVCLSAAGVLAVGVRRATLDGGPQAKLSRVVWNGMLPSTPASGYIRNRPGSRRKELVAVLLATSECAGTRNRDFVPATRAMKAELARRAALQGETLRLVGVALDDRVGDGLALLERVGPFHEVSAGGNWLNSNAVNLIWNNASRSTNIPQWVLVEREVSIGSDAIVVSPERVLGVVVGADGMRAWVSASRTQFRAPQRATPPST